MLKVPDSSNLRRDSGESFGTGSISDVPSRRMSNVSQEELEILAQGSGGMRLELQKLYSILSARRKSSPALYATPSLHSSPRSPSRIKNEICWSWLKTADSSSPRQIPHTPSGYDSPKSSERQLTKSVSLVDDVLTELLALPQDNSLDFEGHVDGVDVQNTELLEVDASLQLKEFDDIKHVDSDVVEKTIDTSIVTEPNVTCTTTVPEIIKIEPENTNSLPPSTILKIQKKSRLSAKRHSQPVLRRPPPPISNETSHSPRAISFSLSNPLSSTQTFTNLTCNTNENYLEANSTASAKLQRSSTSRSYVPSPEPIYQHPRSQDFPSVKTQTQTHPQPIPSLIPHTIAPDVNPPRILTTPYQIQGAPHKNNEVYDMRTWIARSLQ